MIRRRTVWCIVGLALVAVSPARADEVLRLFTWPTYTAPEVLAGFQAETGVAVEVETFDSNEEMAGVLRQGTGRHDVVVPSDAWVARLADEGLLMAFDATRLDGFDGISAPWVGPYFDPGHLYSVPLHWGTTSFMVNTRETGGFAPDSLGFLFEPPAAYRGRVGMLTDARDVIDLALKYLGLPACTDDPADLAALETVLMNQQSFVWDYTLTDVNATLVAGETAIQMIYNGAAMRARQAEPAISYIYPREGITVWSDNLAIPADAPNPEAAMAFIAYLLRPEVIALQSNHTRYGNAIGASGPFLAPEIQSAPEMIIPPHVEIDFLMPCDGAIVSAYEDLWAGVRESFDGS